MQRHLERRRAMNESCIPYGYGARICLGKAFVVVQMELVIACLRIEYCIKVDAVSRTIEGSMKQAGTWILSQADSGAISTGSTQSTVAIGNDLFW